MQRLEQFAQFDAGAGIESRRWFIEEQQPGAKHRFLVGFLKQGRNAVASGNGLGDGVELRECARCGQPTTAEVCSYCRLAERGRRKAAEMAAKYG